MVQIILTPIPALLRRTMYLVLVHLWRQKLTVGLDNIIFFEIPVNYSVGCSCEDPDCVAEEINTGS